MQRLTWSADRLGAWRNERLRALVSFAIQHSPYHRRRLAGVDLAGLGVADLPSLPVMSKADMMEHFDDVVTDRDLTRRELETHLDAVGEDPLLYRDEYFPVVSGGSSGMRGLFVYNRAAMADYLCGVMRNGIARMMPIVGFPPEPPIPLTMVAAPSSIHATRGLMSLTEGTIATPTSVPATLPFDEIVDRVERSRPMILAGYTSTIARLADEQAAGRLRIEPAMVLTTSEQLTEDLSRRIAAGFGAPPANSYATSEGLTGSAPPADDVFTFAGDLAVVEFVDADDRPVPVGDPADHVLLTNLFNHTQPLIRYRLDDRMIECPPAEGHGHQRARLSGRTDDSLAIGGATVHPLAIGTVLLRQPAVVEFQARHTASSFEVDVIADDSIDLAALEADLDEALAAAGCAGVAVVARLTESIPRDLRTGKVRRFVPCT
jgi:phenylacetate-coenzyme A ligase PaaK-like adenylate-forming protein